MDTTSGDEPPDANPGTEPGRSPAERERRQQALAQRIRALKGWKNYTLAQLSERTGLSRQYLSELLRGKRPRPTNGTLERLAEALGVTVRQLRGCDPMTVPSIDTDTQLEGQPRPALPPPAPAPAGRPALGLTSLLTLPPGATVLQETRPDGSVVLYIHIPGGPGNGDNGNGNGPNGGNLPATSGG
jgi:transcriptional regulator with XRE-family HTH domain